MAAHGSGEEGAVIRYDLAWRLGQELDPATISAYEAVEKAQREWCAQQNQGGHRKVKGTSTCIDCGMDLDG